MQHNIKDPISEKVYNYFTDNEKEEHLLEVLSLIENDQCPKDNATYECDRPGSIPGKACKDCYLRLAKQIAGPNTPKSALLMQTIEMAIDDACPKQEKDRICFYDESESTDSEACQKCRQRFATIPFAKFRA